MFQKLKNTIKSQLTQGATPDKLAQSLTAGLLIGCFPLLGWTTGLAALFGVLFKLNHLVVQAANYIMYPVQLLLIPVYIKTVSWIMNAGDVPVRPDLIMKMFTDDWRNALQVYGLISVYAVIMWFIISFILFFILQKTFLPMIQKIKTLKG